MIGHRVVLRPRSLLETGDLAAVFVRTHARAFARLLPWVLVPALVLGVLRALGLAGPLLSWAMFGVMLVAGGVYTPLLGDLMLQPVADLGSVQRRFLRALPSFLVARVSGWTVAVCSLGMVFAWSAFVPEATLLEGGKTTAAFRRSTALLRSTPGRATGYLVMASAVLLAGGAGGELAYLSVRGLFGLSTHDFALDFDRVSWAFWVGLALVMPYLSAIRFLLYIDCRTRSEGWDLQVRMNALVESSRSSLRPDQEAA